MLKAIQERQLIEQDGAQGKAASVAQALRRYLAMTIEDALELLVEILDGHRTQLMKHPPHFDPVAGVRIGTVLRGHQDLPALLTGFLNVGGIVV